ncbi:MAG: hypothetical protein NUW00_01790 [Candidatus Kaiserbacteria bacterium]|nr:hypothetical protein [Candidatus Kaiserbacteria bacterium]
MCRINCVTVEKSSLGAFAVLRIPITPATGRRLGKVIDELELLLPPVFEDLEGRAEGNLPGGQRVLALMLPVNTFAPEYTTNRMLVLGYVAKRVAWLSPLIDLTWSTRLSVPDVPAT